jgi:polysaccharide export outer membrane protein
MSKISKGKARGANIFKRLAALIPVIMAAIIVAACSNLPPAPTDAGGPTPFYRIGPGDALNVFVWQNTQLSTPAIVGPDGRISLPLVKEIEAAGKTPTQLARDIEHRLAKYVTDPVVTVMVSSYVGPFSQQVRVIGEVGKPQAIVYRKGMTVLDAMLAVGGLTQYAAGNRATLVRTWNGVETSYGLRLDKLLQDGDLSANVPLEPGDVITVPQTYF